MKKTLLAALLPILAATTLWCQTPATPPADTTIYDFAEAMPFPLLKSCEIDRHEGWTLDSVRRCADRTLLSLLARNIQYPEAARQKNLEGTVVASFVVEPNGRMSQLKLLKDIGEGCGQEALRVLAALNEAGLRWAPGRDKAQQPVRVRQSLPMRFRLQEALPYYISERGDSIYTTMDVGPSFAGGWDSLTNFVVNRLDYPDAWADSCKTGILELTLLLRPNGTAQVLSQLDFNGLGLDFQFEATRLAKKTATMWTPAQYGGKAVATTVPLRVFFKSDRPVCAAANERFDRTQVLSDEAAALLEQDKAEAAIAKWTEALALQPNNTELLYYRGTALLNLNRRDEACKDYNRVKELLSITWFEGIRKVVCGW